MLNENHPLIFMVEMDVKKSVRLCCSVLSQTNDVQVRNTRKAEKGWVV